MSVAACEVTGAGRGVAAAEEAAGVGDIRGFPSVPRPCGLEDGAGAAASSGWPFGSAEGEEEEEGGTAGDRAAAAASPFASGRLPPPAILPLTPSLVIMLYFVRADVPFVIVSRGRMREGGRE